MGSSDRPNHDGRLIAGRPAPRGQVDGEHVNEVEAVLCVEPATLGRGLHVRRQASVVGLFGAPVHHDAAGSSALVPGVGVHKLEVYERLC